MKATHLGWIVVVVFCLTFIGCGYRSLIEFPPSDDLFVTTGDGDIQKPYSSNFYRKI
jgi:predicted small lipoprotein YifL